MKKILFILLFIPFLVKAQLPPAPTKGWKLWNGISLGYITGTASTTPLGTYEGVPVFDSSGRLVRKINATALGIPTGSTNTVAYFNSAGALVFDLLFKDSSSRVTIGNSTGVGDIQLFVKTANNTSATTGFLVRNSSNTNIFYVNNDGSWGAGNSRISWDFATNKLSFGAAATIGTVPGNSFGLLTNNIVRWNLGGNGAMSASYIPNKSAGVYAMLIHGLDSNIIQYKFGTGFSFSNDTVNVTGGGGSQTLTYTQLATTNTLAISGGNSQTFLTATTNLAGLLDTTRTRWIDSVRTGLLTYSIFANNGLTASGGNTVQLGGTLLQNTSIANAGFTMTHSGTGFERFTSPFGLGTAVTTDANYTVGSESIIQLANITANRTLTLPSASSFPGRELTVTNTGTSTFHWSTSPAISTITSGYVENGYTITLYSDGTNWNIRSVYFGYGTQPNPAGARITTGSSGTMGGAANVYFDFSSAAASYTLTLPANPNDGAVVKIHFGGSITSGAVVTSFTVSPNTSQTIIQNSTPTTGNAGDCIIYQYYSTTAIWYRER